MMFRSVVTSYRMRHSAICFALGVLLAGSPRGLHAASEQAISTSAFLGSIGIVSTFPDRGQPLDRTIEMIRYCGFRWVRAGIEGLSDEGPTTVQTFLDLHRETGVLLSWGLVSGGTDVDRLVKTGRTLADAGALLAFEGNNEPNNWGVTYQGEKGGGSSSSWMAVAKLQRDLYQAVKSDPVLGKYPVWSISEGIVEWSRVVFVAINPANPNSSAAPTISASAWSERSGAILTKIGFGRLSRAFSSVRARSNATNAACSCRSRKPGVFGELTLRTM